LTVPGTEALAMIAIAHSWFAGCAAEQGADKEA
jgi:hypothetical protein